MNIYLLAADVFLVEKVRIRSRLFFPCLVVSSIHLLCVVPVICVERRV